MNFKSFLLRIGAVAFYMLHAHGASLLIYTNDFSEPVGDEWSKKAVNITPVGERSFLGQFSNERVTLALTNLPPHNRITVAFDLFVILTWDGNLAGLGPDIWQMRSGDGTVLVNTTFNNQPEHPAYAAAGQSFPNEFSPDNVVRFPPFTGAAETNTLGFLWSGSPKDAVYRIEKSFAHSESNLTVEFAGIGLQGPGDETWGLDNFSVSITPLPTTTVASVPAPSGLIGWWPGDADFTDLTGRMDGVNQSVVFESGRVGHAFRFVGPNSFVLVPSHETFRALTNVTLECWVWNDQAKPFRRVLTLTPDWAFLFIDQTGRVGFNVRFGDLAATPTGQQFRDATVLDPLALSANSWHHLVGTYDGTAVRLYVDGLLVGRTESPGAMSSQGAGAGIYINFLEIGEVGGLIDEVAVYSRALTAAEIQSHFFAGSAGMAKAPVFRNFGVFFPGEARLKLTGIPGRPLRIEASTDLINWTPVAADANSAGSINFVDSKAGGFEMKFYRGIQR